MNSTNLTDNMTAFLSSALLHAAERYAEDAKAMRAEGQPGHLHLAEQFDRQERQARGLAVIIDDAMSVSVEGDHVTRGQVAQWGEL